ncbi:class I SAM-dependent methyltransferase [Pedobacter jamesrossensis]|uniref:Class I SAM-dependent methyltransferase n=1 Tax=Pedobacter jamesrossensis TaxID=1908238 RepID=A0ABV8NHV1_9SPHI
MENQPSEAYFQEIARQLSCPDGDQGIKTGEVMNINNIGMTKSSINALSVLDGQTILEIGHGNGGHISYLLKKAKELTYFGIDISETIITEAQRINESFIKKNQACFQLSNGESIPFEDNKFDKVFTVNTIYFWKNPAQYLAEIKRVIRRDGLFVLCFADKTFMQSLPFTKYGFTLYDEEEAISLLKIGGFRIVKSEVNKEEIQSNSGGLVTRNYHTIVCG